VYYVDTFDGDDGSGGRVGVMLRSNVVKQEALSYSYEKRIDQILEEEDDKTQKKDMLLLGK